MGPVEAVRVGPRQTVRISRELVIADFVAPRRDALRHQPVPRSGLPAALSVRVPGGHNQYVIALPQPDDTRVYVGLTDTPVDGPIPDEPAADPADVTFLLDTLSTVLGTRLEIGRAHVLTPVT